MTMTGSSASYEEMREREINTAAAVMSTSGPCRQIGDVYLTCVATAGLGMCRGLRASYEQCAKETRDGSKVVLGTLANQACGHVDGQDEKLLCAANLVNRELMRGFYGPEGAQDK
eukprot:CAMPEP_0172504290 /NCGR_PEP_ID=MMETSP1066-20121228/177313_1 /TAXON_ID=671091 /ORGANISM="Coscinodiscus wailesii, Strain CCMP2513" /LENGTH=114 /DNA_ID=CAMNT_0013280405 /DNA_START=142 /DNA_END=483 /DNA_ORIENTATION=+